MPFKQKPAAIAEMETKHQPYSSCVQIDNYFYFSGVVAIELNCTPSGDFKEQMKQIGEKMGALLAACGLTFRDVYSATIMLAGNMDNYPQVNQHWMRLFTGVKIMPRRKVFAVAELPFGCAVEIEFDAVKCIRRE